MRKLFPIFIATLTVSAMACTKAHFVHEPDGGAAGQGAGGIGGGNEGTGGIGGALCQLNQVCPDPPAQSPTDPCDPVCQSGT
jgi:hypothetical protein